MIKHGRCKDCEHFSRAWRSWEEEQDTHMCAVGQVNQGMSCGNFDLASRHCAVWNCRACFEWDKCARHYLTGQLCWGRRQL